MNERKIVERNNNQFKKKKVGINNYRESITIGNPSAAQ